MPELDASERREAINLKQVDHVVFRDDTFRWLDMSTFTIAPDKGVVDPWQALARLLSHQHHYIDRYFVADGCPTHLTREQEANENKQLWLAAMAAHPDEPWDRQMREHLSQPYSPSNAPPTHGPYLMSAISLGSFDLLTGEQALQTLDEWIVDGDDSPSPEQIEGNLNGIRDHLRQAQFAVHLRELGDEAEHELGYLVDPFIELITVDSTTTSIVLLAGGGD